MAMEKNHLRSLQQAHDEAFSKAGSVRLPGEQDGNEHTARGTRRRERGENRQRESNPLDLRRFVKENHADGRIQGRRYWLLPDGKAVLERADGDPENYYESDEAVLRHGERVDFELDGEPKETLYWDAKARQFSELDPLRDTPIIKGERAEQLKKGRPDSFATDQERATAIDDLTTKMNDLLSGVSDDDFKRRLEAQVKGVKKPSEAEKLRKHFEELEPHMQMLRR